MRRYRDRTGLTRCGVLEQTPLGPAAAFVEPPDSRIPRHHSEPGSPVPGIFDPSFCVRHEHLGYAFSPRWSPKRRPVRLRCRRPSQIQLSGPRPRRAWCRSLAAQPSSGTNLCEAPRSAPGRRTRGGGRAIRDARSQRSAARLPVMLGAVSPPSAVSWVVSDVGAVAGLCLKEVAPGIGL
jgi:hypothetical protein